MRLEKEFILQMFYSLTIVAFASARGLAADISGANLAIVAKASTSFVSPHETLSSIQDDISPKNSVDHSNGCYGNFPQHAKQWVQYDWNRQISANGIDVYWWDDHRGVRMPVASRLLYWQDGKFVIVPNATIGLERDRFNNIRFGPISTTRLRLEFDSQPDFSTGLIQWRVLDSGTSPAFPPTAKAGDDRVTVMPAATVLHGAGRGVARVGQPSTGQWSQSSGPGQVTFADANTADTAASFSTAGDYALKFTYGLRGLTADSTLAVHVLPKPAVEHLSAVYASNFKIDKDGFWHKRLKAQVVNWIPHCIDMLDDPKLPQGGIANLIEAGKKNRGEPSQPQVGRPWVNAYILNTVESMSVGISLDPEGDAEIIQAQNAFRKKLDEWIPLILAAQEPDGYFQTRFTLATAEERKNHQLPQRWNVRYRGEHEGYVGGYFIEMGIANYIATGGKDRRLYDAARKLADCWVAHIGPAPKHFWYDGHEEMEQAMVRLGRFVNDTEGSGTGQSYIDLAKFLLDCRGHEINAIAAAGGDFYSGAGAGSEYDQSFAPVTQQYHAAGHAVRATYAYSAMADITAETGDAAYWSATLSIWDNIVNRKLYITGGIGSGETSEGFGPDYSLPNASAYCESCSSCGLLFMQYKLNLATRDSKFADLYETTIYNAILGDVDLDGKNFTYTNSLDSDKARYKWHDCPCCVGNIPRVLLMLPTWTYAKSENGVYVNLFVGSTVNIGNVAGTDVEMIQKTDYPWNGDVAITVNPKTSARFTLYVRSPKRQVSELYSAKPDSDGITAITINGAVVDANNVINGYVAIDRQWKAGDTIRLKLPLLVQTITASDKVAATRGRIALERGPLIYNIESVDVDVNKPVGKNPKLAAQWSPDLLEGIVTLKGNFDDGAPLQAVPNYARLNRGGRSLVWMKQ